MAAKKESTQLLVSPHTLDRARALAVVRHESVAEVNRQALEGFGLIKLERMHAAELDALSTALDERAPGRRSEALHQMIKYKITLAELTKLERFPWAD